MNNEKSNKRPENHLKNVIVPLGKTHAVAISMIFEAIRRDYYLDKDTELYIGDAYLEDDPIEYIPELGVVGVYKVM